jgi:PAP2 superfamily protein
MHVLGRVPLVLSLAALVTAAVSAPAGARQTTPATATDAVSAWNASAGKAAVAACISPEGPGPAEARLYAMTHVAIHDALNAIARRSRPYAYDARARRGTSPDAAVAAAAHDVLVPGLRELSAYAVPACIDAGVASVEADYVAALAAVRDGRAKTRGLALGKAAAAAIRALRATDRLTELLIPDFAYPEGTAPGEYRFTPGTPVAFGPRLGEAQPFVLNDGSQFRPGPPHAVTDKRYTADFNEVKRLGGDGVTTPSARTADQTQIALFWVESSPLQWNRIARTASARTGLDMWESARLFALLNMALTDGYIGSFETKYHYNYWRPVTAIQVAATDGNPDTFPDPTWTPLHAPTPPIPDYDSGHAVQGGTAAAVLRRFFGTDHIRFSTCSTTLPAGSQCGEQGEAVRRYSSFSQAAAENGLSRILVGYHFREAVKVGIDHGSKIGRWTVDRSLQLVRHRHDDRRGQHDGDDRDSK